MSRHYKSILRHSLSQLFFVSVMIVGLSCSAPKLISFGEMPPATRASYGYKPEDPIRIHESGNNQRNVDISYEYISRLRTTDGQSFEVLYQAAIDDPIHGIEKQTFLGFPLRDGGLTSGILDGYALVSQTSKDTVLLYFDIYHKDSLRVPVGLRFVSGTNR